MRDLFYGHVHILKIAHHGSDSSDYILDLLSGDCDIVCSTVYRQGVSNLPIPRVMDHYGEKSKNLFCTGRKDKNDEMHQFGMVTIFTNVLRQGFKPFYQLKWNAVCLKNESADAC